MLSKVNISRIVLDHVRTLRDYQTSKYRTTDFFLFFGVPAIVTGALIYFYGDLRPNLLTIVATSLSVFAALLFNLLLLAYDLIGKHAGLDASAIALRRRFLREVVSNISFAILVALTAIVSVLTLVLVNGCSVAEYVFSSMVYYSVTLFLLTLLMLLKRVHVLLYDEAARDTPNNSASAVSN